MEKTQSSHSIKNIGVELEDKKHIKFADFLHIWFAFSAFFRAI